MLARLRTAAVIGVDAIPVSVEVDVAPGLPGLTMVGLPDATVRESRDRVRTAIRNCGFPFPPDRIIVSLAPADVRKVGAAFDLPITTQEHFILHGQFQELGMAELVRLGFLQPNLQTLGHARELELP